LHPLTKAEVIKTYDRWAPAYDATFGRIVGHYHRHIGKFVRNVGARRVLEIGVGTGLSLQHYPAGASVIGVDICPRMLANARKRVDAGTAADVELQLVDGEALPFADGSFDAVVLPFVISVTPDPDRLLSEVFRVLRPGSPALLLNHFAGVRGLRWMERLFSPFAKFVGFESNLDLGTLLERSAMRVESVQHLRPLGFFTLVTLRKP
jgi:phosphatidylethanolamine/phosphatidyl-N-methylethanolamine N-methyltransferase